MLGGSARVRGPGHCFIMWTGCVRWAPGRRVVGADDRSPSPRPGPLPLSQREADVFACTYRPCCHATGVVGRAGAPTQSCHAVIHCLSSLPQAPSALTWSHDGSVLYVGTASGRVLKVASPAGTLDTHRTYEAAGLVSVCVCVCACGRCNSQCRMPLGPEALA
jgi:hypothetical protein